MAVWNEPLGLTLVYTTLRDWPRLLIEIFSVDSNDLVDLGLTLS